MTALISSEFLEATVTAGEAVYYRARIGLAVGLWDGDYRVVAVMETDERDKVIVRLQRISEHGMRTHMPGSTPRDNRQGLDKKIKRPVVLTCAFCGQQYPPDTPPSQHEALEKHILKCERHPLYFVIQERDRYRKVLERIRDCGQLPGSASTAWQSLVLTHVRLARNVLET